MAAANEISKVKTLKHDTSQLHKAVKSCEPPQAAKQCSIDTLREKLKQKDEELQQKDRQLNMNVQLLNETKKQLSEVLQRLTMAEEETAATQRRELHEEGHSLKPSTDKELRRSLKKEDNNADLMPTVQKGCYEIYIYSNKTLLAVQKLFS